jgi:malate synthase
MLPDRGEVTMTKHFLRSYSLLLIKTCHRRRAHAMGGMAAQIPIKGDAAANDAAMGKASDGHDGTWVAHPGLVGIAKDIFDKAMPQANQVDNARNDVDITAADLLAVPEGTITEAGLRQNINVGILYTEAWLRGVGCVPLYNLMEDAATAEISRTQVWQWVHHGAKLDDGRVIDTAMFKSVIDEEMAKIRDAVGDARFESGQFAAAAELFDDLIAADALEDFLTVPAYEKVLALGG